ncbi:YeiH family protein [Bacillus sp. EAC]|uniref:YeiH family protein n=1 Tax=Bacillus sp. EAC TaxID=1978338 RepID=UPI0015C4FA50|nr:putative sulfate exporter family transporter [Bacillus sp. EAC]
MEQKFITLPNPNEPRFEKRIKGSKLLGIGFTFIMASLGFVISKIPGFDHIGPLACAILLSVVYRQLFDYPEKFRVGIQFSSKILLRFAIILYGLKLNLNVIFHQGIPLLLRGTATILFSIIVLMIIAKWLKADTSLSILLSVGTGVCGAAAIAAISPIIDSKEEDTAMGIGIIALVGTIFSIVYTLLFPFLSISPIDYGSWAGISLHEIAHVALAAAPAGEDALAMALLSKLTRVFLLIPLCFVIMFWKKKKGKIEDTPNIDFPWFLIGFIFMSFIGSYFFGHFIIVSTKFTSSISLATTFILTMAMTGLGLNINIKEVRTKAIRPLIAILITSFLLSILTYYSYILI